jgi:exo-1,4-beta-D-glucosaminidase
LFVGKAWSEAPAFDGPITEPANGETQAYIRLTNNSNHVASFLRSEITQDSAGLEILPIRYADNYVTVCPHESRTLEAVFDNALLGGHNPGVRLEGYDSPKRIATAEKR